MVIPLLNAATVLLSIQQEGVLFLGEAAWERRMLWVVRMFATTFEGFRRKVHVSILNLYLSKQKTNQKSTCLNREQTWHDEPWSKLWTRVMTLRCWDADGVWGRVIGYSRVGCWWWEWGPQTGVGSHSKLHLMWKPPRKALKATGGYAVAGWKAKPVIFIVEKLRTILKIPQNKQKQTLMTSYF